MLAIGASSATAAAEALMRLEDAVFTAVIVTSLRDQGFECSAFVLIEATVCILTETLFTTALGLNSAAPAQLLKTLNPTAQIRDH